MTQKPSQELTDIRLPPAISEDPDVLTKIELRAWEAEERWTELHGKIQDIQARKDYASKVYRLVIGWLIALYALILGVGFGLITVANSVLIALITGTTVNIVGLFVIVARYLFYRRK